MIKKEGNILWNMKNIIHLHTILGIIPEQNYN
jgi:hypothetical protein